MKNVLKRKIRYNIKEATDAKGQKLICPLKSEKGKDSRDQFGSNSTLLMSGVA